MKIEQLLVCAVAGILFFSGLDPLAHIVIERDFLPSVRASLRQEGRVSP